MSAAIWSRMPIVDAMSVLAPLPTPAEGCGLGLVIALAAIVAELDRALPPASEAVQEALLRATAAV